MITDSLANVISSLCFLLQISPKIVTNYSRRSLLAPKTKAGFFKINSVKNSF
jgi:hypothetical protein